MSIDVFYVWDLERLAPMVNPGEVARIRVRARTEETARNCAAAYRGQESDQEWQDPTRSSAVCHGRASVQWAGIVRVLGYQHFNEKAVVAASRGMSRDRGSIVVPAGAISQDTIDQLRLLEVEGDPSTGAVNAPGEATEFDPEEDDHEVDVGEDGVEFDPKGDDLYFP